MYTYNPSFINEAAQLQNYMAASLEERANNGYRQALGNGSSTESKIAGVVAGVLIVKALSGIFDR